jgi:hypothetical protein
MHTKPAIQPLAIAGADGLALIGPSLAALRGHRFADDPAGGNPQDADPKGGDDPKAGDDPKDPKAGDDPKDPKAGDDPNADDEPFDREKALDKIRKANSEAAALRKRLKDEESKGRENADKGEKVTALEAENLRLRVGLKHGLPSDLIDRLKGSTEEEIVEDAEKLLSLFSTGKGKPPTQQPKKQLRGGGDPTNDEEPFDADKFAEEIFRR